MTVGVCAGLFFITLETVALPGVHALVLDAFSRDPNPATDSSVEAYRFRACGLDPRDKIVTWIRHGEGVHNVNETIAKTVRDSMFTQKGKEQAERLGLDPRLHGSFAPELVVSSPLRRTMATALGAFRNLGPTVPWHLEPDIEETASCVAIDRICNYGDPDGGAALLKQEGREDLLKQYKTLPAGWYDRSADWVVGVQHVEERFHRFTRWLLSRPEQRIAVVSHMDFIYTNLGVVLDNAAPYMLILTPGGEWRTPPVACRQQGIVPPSNPPLLTEAMLLAVGAGRCPNVR